MRGTIAKKIFLWLTSACILACCASGQDTPVAWKVTVIKINDSIYNLRVTGSTREGWYVYAATDSRFGLEAVNVQWNNAHLQKLETTEVPQGTVVVADKIFNTRLAVYTGTIVLEQKIKISGAVPAMTRINITAFAAKDKIFLPLDKTLDVQIGLGEAALPGDVLKRANIDILHPLSVCGTQPEQQTGLVALFLLGLGGGLLALLTPCVFPMIPLTVSYFAKTKPAGNRIDRNGLLYGLFIFLIYIVESLPFHLAGNIDPAIFNRISTSVELNLFFFLVFVLFALSLFGVFELRMPGNLSARTGAKSNLQTRSGIFFMAMTLAIVSFSCTGPILGALLAGAIKGSAQSRSTG